MESSESTSRAKAIMKASFVSMISMCIGLFFIVNMIMSGYSKYRQCELDTKKFTLETICHVDQIISRPCQDISSSSIFIKSSFLISFEVSSNASSTKQQFEASSVPIPFQPNMVSIDVQNTIDFRLIHVFLSP
jgi:hypothetical protein